MCSVTWSWGEGGYDLFFNRDELDSRAPEIPPTLLQQRGVRLIAPIDGDRGGTWIQVNEFGVVSCLLNDYEGYRKMGGAPKPSSRGLIVRGTASCRDLDAVSDWVATCPLAATAPFRLVSIAEDRRVLLTHWNGERLFTSRAAPEVPLITSSSFRTHEVMAARHTTFRSLVVDASHPRANELARFHRQHDPLRGAYSVAMCRPGASTRSHCHIAVRKRIITMSYSTFCWTGTLKERAGPVLRLPRAPLRFSGRRSINPRRVDEG